MCAHCLYPDVDSLLEKQQRSNIAAPWENGPTNWVALCVWNMNCCVSKTKLFSLSITITSPSFQEKVCSEWPEDWRGHYMFWFDIHYLSVSLPSVLPLTQHLSLWSNSDYFNKISLHWRGQICPKSSTHIKLWKAHSNKLCWLHWNEEFNFSSLYWIIHHS